MHRLRKASQRLAARPTEALLAVALSAWIALGAMHVAIVMAGPEGWNPDRAAPGAAAVIGHPHDTDPRLVAAPVELARESGTSDDLLVAMPMDTDSADLLYVRYQLAHLMYPMRVAVIRVEDGARAAALAADSMIVVLAPGMAAPERCSVRARAHDHVRVECPAA